VIYDMAVVATIVNCRLGVVIPTGHGYYLHPLRIDRSYIPSTWQDKSPKWPNYLKWQPRSKARNDMYGHFNFHIMKSWTRHWNILFKYNMITVYWYSLVLG
jgi:hypothetical protein